MSLEGLDFILTKREVVPTVSARDLVERAEQVDADYKRHVRTYVPISRSAEGDNESLNVEQFERKLIKSVKEARAPRGYLTAEYGYGKTSTALYLWNRAEEANLVVVPPFQMLHLPDLITAIHGWVRYRLSSKRPEFVKHADELYEATTNISIQKAAQEADANESAIRQWVKEGRYIPDLQTADYLKYFEAVTKLVKDAGFDGLIVLPDEIQQYIEPQMKSGVGDPIAPFFNLIQGLATREGYLCFGFIMVIPLKEIGVIREARGRGDFLDRMRNLSLDLSTVYDQDFAHRLWKKLSEEFNYSQIAANIVRPETLDALGEIASRDDLSNGPRTVINTFRRMVQRFQSQDQYNPRPYTPIDLIDDLLTGGIQFSGNSQIQKVTRQVLQSSIIRADQEHYESAIKLAAAFPNNGVPLNIQKLYKIDNALDELMRIALGDLVIAVGPIDQHGVTLVGLDRVQLQKEWLPQTIRDFRRAYAETHNDTRDRAIEVFTKLLKTRVFKTWKIISERPSTYTSNCSIIFEGDFQAFSSRFPRRRVHIQIYWEDEERKDAFTDGDVLIEYHLSIHRNLDPEARRHLAQSVALYSDEHRAVIPINLMYVRPEGVAQQIQQGLQGVWSPYDLSPLVLMNIFQMIEEKRVNNLIPRQDDQYIQHGFQPELLDNILRDLFNPEVGTTIGMAGERITEEAIERLLVARYGHTYHTLYNGATWRSSLQKYCAALDRLDNRFQKRGEIEFEGSKDKVAELMVQSNTGLDSFIRIYGTLIKLERNWPSREQQSQGETACIRFTLHPQERQIIDWLKKSSTTREINFVGKQLKVNCLELSDIYDRSRELGYLDDEIEQLIQLLNKRELTEVLQQYLLCELPSQSPDVEVITSQLGALQNDLEILLQAFMGYNNLSAIQSKVEQWRKLVEDQLKSGTPDPQIIYKLGQNIRLRQTELRNFASDERKSALRQVETLQHGLRPINPQQFALLERPIEGAVSYVDQVNVLRVTLQRYAQTVRGEVEGFRTALGQSFTALNREDMQYEDLVATSQSLESQRNQLGAFNQKVSDLEQEYQHLIAWSRLVNQGSNLYSTLGQMENVTKTQGEGFDRLSREIRGDISSSSNKRDILPNHHIYESRLNDIEQQVRDIREKAISTFNERQNSYRYALTNSGIYRRDQLGQPYEYNFSNPGESNRLLEEDVQRLIKEACKQIIQIVTRQQQNVRNTLNTPYLKDIPDEERSKIENQGSELLEEIETLLSNLKDFNLQAFDILTVRDFNAPDKGKFAELVQGLKDAAVSLQNYDRRTRELGMWLTVFQLTPEQEQLLTGLSIEGLESLEDLIEWRSKVNCPDDEFWANMRGLYEKRRIRLSVGRVRL
jgi:hypothetical protein